MCYRMLHERNRYPGAGGSPGAASEPVSLPGPRERRRDAGRDGARSPGGPARARASAKCPRADGCGWAHHASKGSPGGAGSPARGAARTADAQRGPGPDARRRAWVSAPALYLDASALVKLVHKEAETDSLRAYLAASQALQLTSVVSSVELPRSV